MQFFVIYSCLAALAIWAGSRAIGYGVGGALDTIATSVEKHIYVIVGIFILTIIVMKA